MSTPAYFNGNKSICQVNGTDINGDGWDAEESVGELDTSNTSTGGFEDAIAGLRKLSGSVALNWDASANPLDNSPGIGAGSVLTNLKLFLNGTSSPFFVLPSALVTSTPVVAKVGGKVSLTMNFRNKGAFTRPTGTFTPT